MAGWTTILQLHWEACTDQFNIHGLLCTLWFSGPVLIVNGPIRNEIGMYNDKLVASFDEMATMTFAGGSTKQGLSDEMQGTASNIDFLNSSTFAKAPARVRSIG